MAVDRERLGSAQAPVEYVYFRSCIRYKKPAKDWARTKITVKLLAIDKAYSIR